MTPSDFRRIATADIELDESTGESYENRRWYHAKTFSAATLKQQRVFSKILNEKLLSVFVQKLFVLSNPSWTLVDLQIVNTDSVNNRFFSFYIFCSIF